MEKKGKSGAVVIGQDDDDELTPEQAEAQARMWRAIEAIGGRNRDKDPDEELAFITEVVEEVRREASAPEPISARAGCR